jgi:hypothetical protein
MAQVQTFKQLLKDTDVEATLFVGELPIEDDFVWDRTLKLTEKGEAKFGALFDAPCTFDDDVVIEDVDGSLKELAEEFCNAVVGYISPEEFQELFDEV